LGCRSCPRKITSACAHNNKKTCRNRVRNPRATPAFFLVFPLIGAARGAMGHPTYPSLPPEPGTVAIAQPPTLLPLAPSASASTAHVRVSLPAEISQRPIETPIVP